MKNRRPISEIPHHPIDGKGKGYVLRFLVVSRGVPFVADKKPELKGEAIRKKYSYRPDFLFFIYGGTAPKCCIFH